MKKLLILLTIVFMIPSLINAEVFAKTGTKGVQFLKLGIDGRAVGMANAYVAVADDIASVYWNPAGLSLIETNQTFFSHTEFVADIKHEFIAQSYITDFGVFAFSGSFLWMDQMDITDEANFGPTGETFTCSDMALGLTYSQIFTDKFMFGFTGKYIREQLYEFVSHGYSVDVGSLYNTGYKNLTVGMALRNFGPDMLYEVDNDGDGLLDEDPFDLLDNDNDGKIDEDKEEFDFGIPMSFSLGVKIDLFEDETQKVIGSAQLESFVDRTESYNIGVEYKYNNFFLRGGKYLNLDAANFSVGLGALVPLRFATINIDYAFSDWGYLSEGLIDSPHRISIKINY